jgi:hydrogenase maturation protein HypF
MFPLAGADGLAHVANSVSLGEAEAELIKSSARPIVLAKRRSDCPLSDNLAPGLNELGVFLPYSPLHEILLSDYGAPLVATSGNISGEPVLTDDRQADSRLSNIADAFVHHDRKIVRPADDPLFRQIDKVMRPLRVGRGVAPVEITLPWRQPEPVICVGGQQKATVTLSWGDRAVVSPHIGDMLSPRSLLVFEQVITDLQSLYGVEATRIICDQHAGYTSHRWAARQPLPVDCIWHHRAHASALVAEAAVPGPWLVFTWDGVGLGEDGTLWGGEALLGDAGNWRRVCSFRPFAPPGGDLAGREPWRSAAALCWESGVDFPVERPDLELARSAWRTKLNSPTTSAAGRLFDAASALICGVHNTSFEAQGPMQIEALCQNAGRSLALPLIEDASGILRSDWEPLLQSLLDTRRNRAERAEDFHSTMARVVLDQAVAMRDTCGVDRIGLSGGVFQNRVLAEQTITQLKAAGFSVWMHALLPCNDAGISLGQAAEWAALQQRANS